MEQVNSGKMAVSEQREEEEEEQLAKAVQPAEHFEREVAEPENMRAAALIHYWAEKERESIVRRMEDRWVEEHLHIVMMVM